MDHPQAGRARRLGHLLSKLRPQSAVPLIAVALLVLLNPFWARLLSAQTLEMRLDRISDDSAVVGAEIKLQMSRSATEEDSNVKVIVLFGTIESTTFKWGGEDNDILTGTVPANLLGDKKKPLAFPVTVKVNGVLVGGQVQIFVYPIPNAIVTKFNGSDSDSELLPFVQVGRQVTIEGTGFFAPKEKTSVKIGDISLSILWVDAEGKSLIAFADRKLFTPESSNKKSSTKNASNKDSSEVLGIQPLEVKIWDMPAAVHGVPSVFVEDDKRLEGSARIKVIFLAALPLVVLAIPLWLICGRIAATRTYKSAPSGGRFTLHRTWFGVLLTDPATNTYSLSSLQFIWWLAILIHSYAFLFIARGFYVTKSFQFYDIKGSAYPFLISLGTLVGSVTTTTLVGSKGAGDTRPSLADLVVHGGVIALDRVQQLAVSFLTGIAFLVIVWNTSATSAQLPDIPEKLLALMGFSAAGYLAGKLARKAGPIISQVLFGSDGLHVGGSALSVDARVFVNGQPIDRERIKKTLDPDKPAEFATAYTIAAPHPELKAGSQFTVTVVNPDAQEAKWVAPGPLILSATVATDAAGKKLLTVRAVGSLADSILRAPGLPPAGVKPASPETPGDFKVEVDEAWASKPHELIIENPGKERPTSSLFRYTV